jgi:hypothetical protein
VTRNELSALWIELMGANVDIQRRISDVCHGSLKKIADLEAQSKGPAFNHELGTVVLWDGDLWFLNYAEDIIYPLGHTRGGREVVKEGDPENGGITLQCLVDVVGLLSELQEIRGEPLS